MINVRFVRTTDKYLGICLCYLLAFLDKVAKLIWGKGKEKKKQKILMIKFTGIGNIVMILPTIKAVKKRYPEARIDVFTLLTNREVLRHNRFIDIAHFLNERNFFTFFVTYLRNAFRLKRERYDMVLDFEQFAKTSSVFTLLIGARERIGFDTPGQGRGIAYT